MKFLTELRRLDAAATGDDLIEAYEARLELQVLLHRHATDIAALVEAAQALHDDVDDYQRLNNLGGYDNHCMKWVREALAALDKERT